MRHIELKFLCFTFITTPHDILERCSIMLVLSWVWLEANLYSESFTLRILCARTIGFERNQHGIKKSHWYCQHFAITG